MNLPCRDCSKTFDDPDMMCENTGRCWECQDKHDAAKLDAFLKELSDAKINKYLKDKEE